MNSGRPGSAPSPATWSVGTRPRTSTIETYAFGTIDSSIGIGIARAAPSSVTRRADITPARSTVTIASAFGNGLLTRICAVSPTS